MNYKQLFIFVEGDRDDRFHQKIIKPILSEKYNVIKTIQWSQKSKKYLKNFIRSITFADYLWFADIDSSPCVSQKKDTLYEFVDNNKTLIVIKEIESWYLAGLDFESAQKLKIEHFKNTDGITKQVFSNLVKQRYNSEIDAMIEILKYFSIETAKTKNKSFKYFIEKYT